MPIFINLLVKNDSIYPDAESRNAAPEGECHETYLIAAAIFVILGILPIQDVFMTDVVILLLILASFIPNKIGITNGLICCEMFAFGLIRRYIFPALRRCFLL